MQDTFGELAIIFALNRFPCSVYASSEIDSMERSIKKTTHVGFVVLMKALLAKMPKSRRPERSNVDVLVEAGRIFIMTLNDTIIFCNTSLAKGEERERESPKEGSGQKEGARSILWRRDRGK